MDTKQSFLSVSIHFHHMFNAIKPGLYYKKLAGEGLTEKLFFDQFCKI